MQHPLPQPRKTFSILGKAAFLLGSSLLCGALGIAPASAQVSVLTQHNDMARTGTNLKETTLNTSNVNVNQFGKLFSRTVDSLIWTQPLYMPGLTIPGVGVRNVVFVGTENASMYAFDADDPNAANPLWKANLAPAPYTSGYKGIVGTPVIDSSSKVMYVVAHIQNPDGSTIYQLHKLDVTTGLDKTGSPVQIQGSVPGTGVGSANGVMTFNPEWERQRPGLLLLNGILYIAFGSINSELPGDIYYGWLFAYNASTLQRTGIFCGAPDGLGSTLWSSGQGPASDGKSIFVMTGNGKFSATTGGKDYGDSFIRFSGTNGALGIADFFTPFDEDDMDREDKDLGSSGPMLLPGTNLIVGGGKTGTFYVVDRTLMGGHRLDNDSEIVQSFPAFNGHLHGSLITWSSPSNGRVVYGWSEEDQLKVWKFAGGKFNPTPIQRSSMAVPPGMPGGFLSLSANGSAPGTGILWAYHPYDGDANPGIVNGILRAFDANDVTHELWNSRQNTARDDLGKYAKFNYATVTNGKVYLPTFSNQLVVYGLLSAPTKPSAPAGLTATAGDSKVTLAWSAATGAASYTLKRSDAATGPFTAIASNLTALTAVDTSVINGKKYYYVVSASNTAGESANSNIASATPVAAGPSNKTQGISVDFIGGGPSGNPTAMATTETAGAVALPFWNAASAASGTSTALKDSNGAATMASVNWSAAGTYSSVITEAAGNARMMKGYLNTTATSTSTVTFASLPATYTGAGYDVYVYFDGNNAGASRTGTYTLGSTTISGTDAPNTDFAGTFKLASNSAGNYLRFNNLTAGSFTLSVTPGTATDANPRAPINGIQIVMHGTKLASPSVAVTTPAAGLALQSIASIAGTATDNSGAGLTSVGLVLGHIKADGITREYWSGKAWSSASTTLKTTLNTAVGTWASSAVLPSGATLLAGSYFAQAKAVDAGGRSTIATNNFLVDFTAPIVTVTMPANATTISSLNSVSGTAIDETGGSGVVRVDLVLTRASDGERWSYTAWVAAETGIDTVLTGNNWLCNQNLPTSSDLSDGQYTLTGVAYDRAGNVGGGSSVVTLARSAAAKLSMRASSVEVSSAIAHSDEGNVELFFIGPLKSTIAGDRSHYSATVNGKEVKVGNVVYNPDNHSVLVMLPENSIAPGDKVQVQWKDLSDLSGSVVAGQTDELKAF